MDTEKKEGATLDEVLGKTAKVADDLAERVKVFNVALGKLLGEHELALYAEPRIADGKIVADPRLMDARPKAEDVAPADAAPSTETEAGDAEADEVVA